MTAPPARNTLSGTPTNAQFNTGIGALYDYTVGLLGAAGTPAAARAALDAVGLTGDQTIDGVKRFTGLLVAGSGRYTTDSTSVAMYEMRLLGQHASAWRLLSNGTAELVVTDGLGVVGSTLLSVTTAGHLTATGNITAGGQFIGNGAGLTNLAAAQLTGDVAAARIANALNATGSAPIYACRAWVNFDGTGTVAIRASGNVSSITDNGVGDYTVNFTNAMPDANYAVCGVSDGNSISDGNRILAVYPGGLSTSGARITCTSGGSTVRSDQPIVSVAIFR